MIWGMKRYIAAALWLYAAWYVGSAISMYMNAPDVLGPVLGLAAGLIVGLDPRHVIWTRGPTTARTPSTTAVPTTS